MPPEKDPPPPPWVKKENFCPPPPPGGPLKSTVYESNPHTIHELKGNFSHGLQPSKSLSYIGYTSTWWQHDCWLIVQTLYAIDILTPERISQGHVQNGKAGYLFVAHPVFLTVTYVRNKQMTGGPVRVTVNFAVLTVILSFDNGNIQVFISTWNMSTTKNLGKS